jgi:methanogenic corrinoid protein MtbC1
MSVSPFERIDDQSSWSGAGDTAIPGETPLAPGLLAGGAPRAVLSGHGLISMVESEIIPRLMLAHRSGPPPAMPTVDPDGLLGPDTTETFARMAVSREPDSLIAFVGGLLQAGVSLDTIYMELLVPAARRLGEYWEEDTASFTDVTIGLGRLQQVVRALGWKTPSAHDNARLGRSAFFALGPGEQHMFGLFIIEDFFRRAGWRTWIETAATNLEVIETVRGHWFDLFGMSLSVDTHLDEVAATIRAVRAASRNPNIFVMVGGRLFLDQPELLTRAGADATASSGGEALLVANHALLGIDKRIGATGAGA